jgi:hypothetical protein
MKFQIIKEAIYSLLQSFELSREPYWLHRGDVIQLYKV